MSRQGVLFRVFNLIGTNRVIFSNRINHVNFQFPPSLVMGVKHVARDNVKTLDIPEKPKKPLSPFFKFIAEHRERIQKENPDLNQRELVLKCGEIWRNMSEEQKERYTKGYSEELEDFKVKWIKFDEKLTPEQKTALKEAADEKAKNREHRKIKKLSKETNKPKRPISPFLRYVTDQAKLTDKSQQELMKEFKGKYPELPESVKAKYEAEYAKERQQYERELQNWKDKVLKEGLGDKLKIKENVEETVHEKMRKMSASQKRGQPKGNQ